MGSLDKRVEALEKLYTKSSRGAHRRRAGP